MKSRAKPIAIASLGLLLSCGMLAMAMSPFAPQQGMLLLKSGQVIEGGILREGDRFVVTLGPRGQHGELKIPASDVDIACRSLEEAYQHKRNSIKQHAVKPHVALADWCLRQGLPDRAAEELVQAMSIDARDPSIAAVEQRLRLTTARREAVPAPRAALPPSPADIENAIRTVPPEVVDTFAKEVQPVLLSRCAATACHGPGSPSRYHLVRPPLQHANKLRETQRNILATLGQIGADEESPLLAHAVAAHGGTQVAPLDSRDRRQIEQLAAWVAQVNAAAKQPVAKMREDSQVRPASFQEEVAPRTPAAPRRLPRTAEPATFQPEPSARRLTSEERPDAKALPPARDPFDPRVFNERYHAKDPAADSMD